MSGPPAMRRASLRGWWQGRGLQVRSTLVAVGAVALALLLLGAGGLLMLRMGLQSSARHAAVLRAEDLAAQVTQDADAAIPTVGVQSDDGMLLQVFDAAGGVIAQSPALAGRSPLVPMAQPGRRPLVATVHADMPDRTTYLVAYTSAAGPNGQVTVAAAQSLEERDRMVREAALALLLMSPILLLAVGLATWISVGRSLTTVDAIRASVARIGAGSLDSRVPVPAAHDAIQSLAATMNQMLDRLESSAEAQRRFIADASHELKSPLASMTTALDVGAMTDGAIDRPAAEVLRDEVHRMSRLVSDLLLLAQADEGHASIRSHEVDLDDVAAHAAQRVRLDARLTVLTAIECARVVGDADRLERMLRNLTDNACRFAHSAVRIAVRNRFDGRVLVSVEDDGPGVPPDKREAIFERFVRLDEHRSRDGGGTGLGLAIVREIARAHGGTAQADDSELGGARILVLLPAVRDVEPIAREPVIDVAEIAGQGRG